MTCEMNMDQSEAACELHKTHISKMCDIRKGEHAEATAWSMQKLEVQAA